MNNPNELPVQAAIDLGVIRVLQALTAVVYRDTPERDILEEQLRNFLNTDTTGFEGKMLETYKTPIQAALNVIDHIKAAQ